MHRYDLAEEKRRLREVSVLLQARIDALEDAGGPIRSRLLIARASVLESIARVEYAEDGLRSGADKPRQQ